MELEHGKDSLSDYSRGVFTELDSIDLNALLALIEAAWAQAYQDEVRPDIDEAFLRKITASSGWFGVLVYASDDTPVGVEIAFPRRLVLCERYFNVFYVTAFSVAPEHRRRGVGAWVLDGINREAFERREANLLFSTFDRSQAGSDAVQSAFDRTDYTVLRFHETPLWVLRLNDVSVLQGALADITAPQMLAVRSDHGTSDNSGAGIRIRAVDADVASHDFPSIAELDATIRNAHQASFSLDASFVTQYLHKRDTRYGESLWFSFDDGAWCWINYGVNALAFNYELIGASAQLQTLHHEGCTNTQLSACIGAVVRRCKDRGYLAFAAFNQLAIDAQMFPQLGFQQNGQFNFSVRGPSANVNEFVDLNGPHFLDFL